MSQQWYIFRGGQSWGPVAVDKLQAMARAGELGPQELVAPVGGAQWTPAASVPGLFSPASQSPPPKAPPVTAPPLAPPRPQASQAPRVAPVAPAVRRAVVAQAAAPPPPSIEVEAHSTFEQYQWESFRSVRDDLSKWIIVPALILMLLHAGAVVALPCWWLYHIFTVLQGVNDYSRVAWGRIGFEFALLVVVPVLLELVEFRIARGMRRGERSAAYGLLISLLSYVALGAAIAFVPDVLPDELQSLSEMQRWVIGGVLLGIVGLLKLPALVGAICDWDKFE